LLPSNGRFRKAIEFFNKAIEINPAQSNFYSSRALSHQKLLDFEAAASDFSVAINLDSEVVDYYILRAEMNHEREMYALSAEDFTKAISISPENYHLYYKRGISYYDDKEFELAEKDFIEVLRYDSINQDALWYLALNNKALGNETKAIAYYEKVKSLNPEYPYLWSIDKNQLKLKKFVKDNWVYTIILVGLLIAALFFVRKMLQKSEVKDGN
jgi:tetratricopeptide (TPR) repeat protein